MGFASVSEAQNVVNPSEVEFELSIDHAAIMSYEVDLINPGGSVIATIDLGKPAGVAGDVVQVGINVQPITFGNDYTGQFRAVFDSTVQSADVASLNNFNRVPGGPSRPSFR